jgi:hypothetical protein
MQRISKAWVVCGLMMAAGIGVVAQAPKQPPTPAQGITANFTSVNRRVLEMAKDFPEAQYGYRPNPDVRTFGEVIVHVLSGNVYAAKVGRGETATWDDVDAKLYKNKTEIVAALQKSIDESTAALKAIPPEQFAKTLAPWLAVIEHSAEHYGQLVVYYRLNRLVPPESRPKPKKG